LAAEEKNTLAADEQNADKQFLCYPRLSGAPGQAWLIL
jgi:hypothetical protein